MKNLIYFVVGVDPKYIELTKFCVYTLRMTTDLSNIDILVMCDYEYSKIVAEAIPFAKIHVTPPNGNNIISSMRKIEIFSYDSIGDYEKILYLDSDIVILGDVSKLFENQLKRDVLYAKKDADFDSLKTYMHGLCLFGEEDLRRFAALGQHPFCAGHFLFENTKENRRHFESVLKMMRTWEGSFFFEQSFLNHYFQTNGRYDLSLLDEEIEICKDGKLSKGSTAIVAHFANSQQSFGEKLHNMRLSFFEKNRYAAGFSDTRDAIGRFAKLPEGSRIAEIGVFQGDFSTVLLSEYRPSAMVLIDPFEGRVSSGDADGNDVRTFDMEKVYHNVIERFSHRREVTVLRSRSSVLECFPDGYFDMIYIDGDHSYEGVKYDLDVCYKKIREGGWVCGHDFGMNPEKTDQRYDFGVEKAVFEFCFDRGLHIGHVFMDGCKSYAIRINKI